MSPVNVDLNPAQQRTILVSGGSPPLTATLDGKLVQVAVNDNATGATITATQQTGSDVLHLVDANGARADIPIRVAFNAGTIAATATLKVTGSPADGSWLVAQVKGLVARLTQAMPGAQITFGSPVPPVPTPLPTGASMQFSVPVQIASTDGQYFDQSGSTVVNVQNVPADAFAPLLLFYDDDPEHVNADGVLFRGTVSERAAVALILLSRQRQRSAPDRGRAFEFVAGPDVGSTDRRVRRAERRRDERRSCGDAQLLADETEEPRHDPRFERRRTVRAQRRRR